MVISADIERTAGQVWCFGMMMRLIFILTTARLDISSSISDEIMTNMPLAVVSEDCKGIHLETGKESEQEAIDPRWKL